MLGAGFTWVKWLELNGNNYFMRKCLVMAIGVSIFSISAGQLSSWSFFSFTTSWQPSTKLQRWSVQGVDYNYLIRQIPANLPILTLFLICYCITFCILYYNALYFKFDINLAFIKPVDALTMACLASITLFQSCQHRCQYMRERVEPLIDFKTYWFLEFHRSSLENLINCLFTLWLITMSTQSQYVHSMWYNVSIGRLCNVSVAVSWILRTSPVSENQTPMVNAFTGYASSFIHQHCLYYAVHLCEPKPTHPDPFQFSSLLCYHL